MPLRTRSLPCSRVSRAWSARSLARCAILLRVSSPLMGANKTPKPSPMPKPNKKLFIAASWEVVATDCVRPLACREDARRSEKFAASFPQAAAHERKNEVFCYTRLPMIPGFATREGTARFRDRFPALAHAGHFRQPEAVPHARELWLSSIGLGTYLGETSAEADAAYTEAIIAALQGGVNVLDTAI